MTTPAPVTPTLAARRGEQTARRQKWLDRIVSAPGQDARRSEALDAIAAEGNFNVQLAGTHIPMTVARFTRWVNDQRLDVKPGQARPC